MHISCAICMETVCPWDSLIVTKCGHLFHRQCMTKWLERVENCPQCRQRSTSDTMRRFYLNDPTDMALTNQYSTLKYDNLMLEMQLHIQKHTLEEEEKIELETLVSLDSMLSKLKQSETMQNTIVDLVS